MALPALGSVKDEISEVGIMMDDGFKSMDSGLKDISVTLKKMFTVDVQVKSFLEDLLNLNQKQFDEDNLNRGLELEAQREAGMGQGDSKEKERKDLFKDVEMGASTLGMLTMALGGFAVGFQDEIKKFLNSFGIATDKVDNIAAGIAAQRFLPKPTPRVIAPKPTPAPKPLAFKNPAVNAKSLDATKILQNVGKDQLGKTMPIEKPKSVAEKTGDLAKKAAVGTENVAGSWLGKMSRFLGRAATPLYLGYETYNVGKTANDDSLTQEQKNIEYSKTGGRVGGGLTGMYAGASVGSFLGPVGTVVGGIAGGLLGSYGGEELAEWLAKMGWGSDEKEPAVEPKSGYMTPDIAAEDAIMSKPVQAQSATQMYGMNAQGFNAAAKSRAAIAAENIRKIDNVKPTISGDNKNVTIKVEKASKETVDAAKIQPIIRQGDTVNNVTNINNSSTAAIGGSVVPSAKRERRSPAAMTEVDDAINGP